MSDESRKQGGYVKLGEQVPGPKSRAAQELRKRYIAAPLRSLAPFAAARARGPVVEDLDGNSYLDFSGGWGVLNVGHNHPKVVEAVHRQTDEFLHTDFTAVPYAVASELGARLAILAPGDTPKKCALFNSGAEAVENAVKIARVATRRKAIVVFEQAFHGRTLLTMTMTHKAHPYKAGFGPYAPDVYRLPYPYPYRYPISIQDLERRFLALVDPEEVACVVVEPVAGEGGFIVPPADFLPFLRELADRHGFLLVADEVQCGVGRTGTFFASERFAVEPDLIACAKSIAGGMPLSCVLGKASIMDSPVAGAIGSTFGGNPLACAAALAVLDIIDEERLLSRADHVGQILRRSLAQLQGKHPLLGDVRGLGAMVGAELVRDRSTKEPAWKETASIQQEALARGLILATAGVYDNVIRFLVPLNIPDAALAEGLEILAQAFAVVDS